MEEIIINPQDYTTEYIENLNKCFNGWGGEKEYKWVFERKVGDYASDILLIRNEADGVIAGSGITYRKISKGNKGEIINIGVMTGSWTLPAARRKGCFSKMIQSSKEICEKKNVPYLTAFVTESNASYRRLESAGSYLLRTYHLFSPEVPFKLNREVEIQELKASTDTIDKLFEAYKKTHIDALSYTYQREEFLDQYLNRLKKTLILKINDDYAVLEDGTNEVKILLLTYKDPTAFRTNMQLLTNWCLENKSQKAFFFTTKEELFNVCVALGFENVPGYFTILKTSGEDNSERIFKSLEINMADKM